MTCLEEALRSNRETVALLDRSKRIHDIPRYHHLFEFQYRSIYMNLTVFVVRECYDGMVTLPFTLLVSQRIRKHPGPFPVDDRHTLACCRRSFRSKFLEDGQAWGIYTRPISYSMLHQGRYVVISPLGLCRDRDLASQSP